MVSAVEFIIGLAIGSGLVSVYFYIRARRGGEQGERFRKRLRQALTIFGVSTVLGIAGEILIRL